MEQAAPPRRYNPVRALIKGILHAVVKTVIVTGRTVKRYPLPALIVIIMFFGSMVALTSGMVALPAFGTMTLVEEKGTAGSGAAANTERATVENYLTGQKDYNATLMWEALSDDLRANMRQNGQSAETFQQAMEQMKQRGLRYTDFKYVASAPLDDGRTVLLYIVSATDGQQSQQMPYTFTLNRARKIEKID